MNNRVKQVPTTIIKNIREIGLTELSRLKTRYEETHIPNRNEFSQWASSCKNFESIFLQTPGYMIGDFTSELCYFFI